MVSVRLYFLEILEGCCALMILMHWVASTKVVLNTKPWSKEQGDGRSAARNFAFSLEPQQHLGSRTQFESTAGEESSTSEGYVRIRRLGELQDSFLVQPEVRFIYSGPAFSKINVLAETEANPRKMLHSSVTVTEIEQFAADLFI